MTKGKYLGIDFGDRRVGIAVSDLNKEISFPREVLTYEGLDDLVRQIHALCLQEEVIKVILGLPIQMDGAWGERAEKTQKFGDKLQKALGDSIEVTYFDERLTTRQATHILREQGYKTHEQKGKRDAISAQQILQGYLDAAR